MNKSEFEKFSGKYYEFEKADRDGNLRTKIIKFKEVSRNDSEIELKGELEEGSYLFKLKIGDDTEAIEWKLDRIFGSDISGDEVSWHPVKIEIREGVLLSKVRHVAEGAWCCECIVNTIKWDSTTLI